MFPTANSIVYRNEDGEVLGWDQPADEPDINDWYDQVGDDRDPDPEDCDGTHGDAHQVDGDLWECDICGEQFQYTESRGYAFDSNFGQEN